MTSNCIRSLLFVAVAMCAWLASGASAQATVLFSDDFEGDTLGNLPTISGGDIGSGYHQVSVDVANTDVENDAASSTLEVRAGQYLNVANDNCCENGNIIAQFPIQNSGTLTATFAANAIGASDGGSLGMTCMNAGGHISGLHSGYLTTGFWLQDQALITLPAGVGPNDMVISFYNGSSYEVLKKVGGTEADGAAINGKGLWQTVTLSQEAALGSFPQFSLNGVLLEPIPLVNGIGPIDGLAFGSNGGPFGQAYVDDVSVIPEPCSAVLLVIGSLLGFAGPRKPRRNRPIHRHNRRPELRP